MILDRLENWATYRGLGKRFELGLQSLRELAKQPDGNYELDGKIVYAIVQRYQSKPRDKGKWEAHRKYIDIQYIDSGIEQMGCAPLPGLEVSDPYDAGRDVEFFQDNGVGEFFRVPAGSFTVFYPHDVHMPSLQIDGPVMVGKVVIKIAVDSDGR